MRIFDNERPNALARCLHYVLCGFFRVRRKYDRRNLGAFR